MDAAPTSVTHSEQLLRVLTHSFATHGLGCGEIQFDRVIGVNALGRAIAARTSGESFCKVLHEGKG
jgi:hypothetical protein